MDNSCEWCKKTLTENEKSQSEALHTQYFNELFYLCDSCYESKSVEGK